MDFTKNGEKQYAYRFDSANRPNMCRKETIIVSEVYFTPLIPEGGLKDVDITKKVISCDKFIFF